VCAAPADGNDPSIRQFLERIYIDNYREPLPEFGPFVPPGIPRRRAVRSSFAPNERSIRRPEGTLIAHLAEHTGPVTSIAVSPDHVFFVTGSEDGTVKVWDSVRLEKNVTSRARHTYQQGGRVTSVCMLENTHCVASASDNGTLWVHRVDVSLGGTMPRYGKHHLIRQHKLDKDHITCMLHFDSGTSSFPFLHLSLPGSFLGDSTPISLLDSQSKLVYATASSSIVTFNVRTMRVLQTLENPRHLGPISAMCVDRKKVWLVAGTATGTLSLWDLRFGLLLRTWRVGDGGGSSGGAQRIHQCTIHPTKGKGRWVMVAVESPPGGSTTDPEAGGTAVEVWDVEHAKLVESFQSSSSSTATKPTPPPSSGHGREMSRRSSSVSTTPSAHHPPPSAEDADLSPAAAIEAFLQSSAPTPLPPAPAVAAGGVGGDGSAITGAGAGDGRGGGLFAASRRAIGPGVYAFVAGHEYGRSNGGGGGGLAGESSSAKEERSASDVKVRSVRGGGSTGGSGYLLTGSEDRKLRYWDLGAIERSCVVSDPDLDEEKPVYRSVQSRRVPSPLPCRFRRLTRYSVTLGT
jgi:phosphoinositide-3-kinase regulatory subunit 4